MYDGMLLTPSSKLNELENAQGGLESRDFKFYTIRFT